MGKIKKKMDLLIFTNEKQSSLLGVTRELSPELTEKVAMAHAIHRVDEILIT